jgi:predicted Fe-Mo cluster-binding NifX family protein
MRTQKLALLAVLCLLPLLNASTDPPRIAVASEGSEASSEISGMAARAPFILIFDHEANLVETLDNRDLPRGGAGTQTARVLAEKGITHFVAVRFGPNLTRGLDAAGIEYVEMEGTASEAVREILGADTKP